MWIGGDIYMTSFLHDWHAKVIPNHRYRQYTVKKDYIFMLARCKIRDTEVFRYSVPKIQGFYLTDSYDSGVKIFSIM